MLYMCVCMCVYIYVCVYLYIYIYTEYYSSIKTNDVLPFEAKWMDLENIMLGEISQTEKDKYCVISLICEI